MKLAVTEAQVETALGFLVETSTLLGELVEQAHNKESMVKHTHALEMKKWNEQSVGAQQREAYASQRYLEAITEDAQAAGALAELRARREAAMTTISVYQSMVKDRQGPRP